MPRQADCFQHRATVEYLAAAMSESQTVVLCQVLAGTGGMGKTQLAAHHARTAWQTGQLDLLVWVAAGSRDAIISTYAQAGIEVAGADPEDPERAAARFLHWAETTDRRWLIVLDDLTDPADLRGLWPPRNPSGRTLVTTRRRDAALTGPARHRIDVGVFAPEEAAAYLTTVLTAHGCCDDPQQISGLAADLGHLPLALAQAAAYLTDLGLSCAAYRARLADRSRTLPSLLPDPGGLPDDYHATVAATWSLCLEYAERLRPRGLARPLLALAAMLDPNGIPHAVLTSPPALAYLTEHRTSQPGDPGVGQQQVTAADAGDALRCLHRLSLADHTPGIPHRALRVHALIQRVAREDLPTEQHDRLVRVAADALLAAWPDIIEGGDTTDLAQALRSNTDALTHHARDALYHPGIHPVLFQFGHSLGSSGRFTGAITYYQHLARTTRHHLGADHPDTLTARGELAFWQGAREPAKGVAALADLLSDQVRVLGPEHSETLRTRHNAAFWQSATEHAADAVAAHTELLADKLRVLGPDHPSTLLTRQTLALSRGRAGDAAGAVTGFTELLADQIRVLGPEYPDTLKTRHLMALCRWEAGDRADAITALTELLADAVRVLGPDHGQPLGIRRTLALWQGKMGNPVGSVNALTELLADAVRVLGPDHDGTFVVREDLTYWQQKAETKEPPSREDDD
ncbi:tetratricopeptide repeat protein [Streptomyces purpurogeneiscleroticus]|uniref:tetratricopeptide repeat protein n=1 Tax=Streptomyces purpurogeneiscleroticus TaxID=68259 RepID=UPI001CBF0C85|nr:tetratricopeptide repeat protein [Streptomyces purpurogeneiscleroticus]MBZ4014745.1 hypothetical protein [Streptomyces purpurogeneiscleroticus]